MRLKVDDFCKWNKIFMTKMLVWLLSSLKFDNFDSKVTILLLSNICFLEIRSQVRFISAFSSGSDGSFRVSWISWMTGEACGSVWNGKFLFWRFSGLLSAGISVVWLENPEGFSSLGVGINFLPILWSSLKKSAC